MTETLPLDGTSLTLEQFLAVVRGGCAVSLSAEARARIAASRRVVERAVASGRAVYGVTTGFGELADRTVDPADARVLQLRLIRSHSSGAGPNLSVEAVRGMMLLRANSLARGHSGVRLELVDRLLEMLNRRLHPAVPEQGSVGASGDLAPLAHLALALIGEGEFLGAGGAPEPAAERLAREGLGRFELAEKEGVALINGTSLMATYLVLGVEATRTLLEAGLIAAAVSFDALQGDPQCLDARLGQLRNLPAQVEVAARLRALLQDSGLAVGRTTYRGQDPYTLRCLPQVLGSVRLALGFAEQVAAAELNAVSDNPVVFEGEEFVNGGNFHGQSLAWTLDCLALAVQHLAAFSERRVARLVHPALNRGLPAFLAAQPGLSSGLMIAQYLCAALVNENSTLVHPASAMSLSTSADQEDFVSMGAWAGAKLQRIIDNTRRVLATEWLVAGQALELRRPARGGLGSEAALRALREIVGPWGEDRPPGPEIARVAAALADGRLVARVRRDVPF